MKKRLLSVLLIGALTASMLVGCGSSSDGEGEAAEGAGSVYYLNFKPEADQAWQDLAAQYTEETGVEVKVVTAASGEYEQTLTAEMAKDSAPTMFQAGNNICCREGVRRIFLHQDSRALYVFQQPRHQDP